MSGERPDETLLAACRRFGQRTALGAGRSEASYSQLATMVDDRARALDQVLRHASSQEPDRIGVYADNSVDYIVSYFAILHTGRVPLLIDAAFGRSELQEVHAGCGVGVFLVDRARSSKFPLGGVAVPISGSGHDLVTVAATGGAPSLHPDTAVCRFTSGTTGLPKCLEFSRSAVRNAAENWCAGTGLSGDDRTLCLATLTNGLAFNTSLLSSFLVGAGLHLYRGLPTSIKVAEASARSRATRLVAFPVVYKMLLDSGVSAEHFAGLQLAISAGAALATEVRAGFEARYRVRIADYYGVAEVGPCTFERDPAYRRGLGTALPGVTLCTAMGPTGQREIMLRTASMATRYLNAPGLLEEHLHDGYFATGDLGYVEDSRLFVTGRVGGPVNLAGRKVDPREVERVVCGADGVADAIVFADRGTNDEVFLHAVVSTSRPLERSDIVAECRGRLAPYKIPQRVSFLAEIPRSSSGKVRMADLLRSVGPAAEQVVATDRSRSRR